MLQTPIKPYNKSETGDEEEGEEGKREGKKSIRRREGERLVVKEVKKSDAVMSGDEDGMCITGTNLLKHVSY